MGIYRRGVYPVNRVLEAVYRGTMNIQLPQILANISGPMIVVFGLVYILVTFNSRGVAPAAALVSIIAGMAIIVVGVLNIVLAYSHVGRRWAIAANAVGVFFFAAATLLTMAPPAIVGLILFAFASVCSAFVLSPDGRARRHYPHGL
jgi:hypothetical protein